MALKYNQKERSIFDFGVRKDFKDFLCIEALIEATMKKIMNLHKNENFKIKNCNNQ